MATRALLTEICVAYEKAHGVSVQIEATGGVDAAKRVAAGAAFDVVILGSDAIDRLMADGHLAQGSRVDLVKSEIAVATKKGAPRAMIATASALKSSLIAAKSISTSTGPSGVYLAGLFEKMGIADLLKAKTVVPKPGIPVGSLVASGEVEIGFQQLSELINIEGIDVLGTLPVDIAYVTTFSAGIPKNLSADRQLQVSQFLRFSNSAQATPAKLAQGMTPAH